MSMIIYIREFLLYLSKKNVKLSNIVMIFGREELIDLYKHIGEKDKKTCWEENVI